MRILFVENHAEFAAVTTRAFMADHDVVIVPSLADARAALDNANAASPFEVVLLDYDLDDGKGDELLPDLLALQPRPAIIAISSREAGNHRLTEGGADAVCDKLEFRRLPDVLQAVVAKRAPGHGRGS